jgi:RES domain-containing protein
MAEFASLDSYERFERVVKTKSRFGIDDTVREFLKAVRETVPKRVGRLRKDKLLFRAQRGSVSAEYPAGLGTGDDEEEEFETINVEITLPPDLMVPKAEKVGDGRVNPRGIPCLYLATTMSAAISEMRPWVGEFVTLAQFRVMRDCQLVDCSRDTTRSIWHDGTKEEGVWGDIGFAFSRPINREESTLDYVPTQMLAETFKSAGFDGIVYKSLLDENGKNVALFDVNAAQLETRCLYQANAVSLECKKHEISPTTWPNSVTSELRRVRLEY